MTLEDVIGQASASLIDGCTTAPDVAAKLKAAQCEGRRGNPLQCPLAMWYRAALRERRLLRRRQELSVDGTTWGRAYLYVHVRQHARAGTRGCPPVPVPGLLVDFAKSFDSGGFPELVS